MAFDRRSLEVARHREAYKKAVAATYPNVKPGAVPVIAGTLFKFVNEMKKGDLAIYPSKADRMVNLGVIDGEYEFLPKADEMQCPNRRKVKWIHRLARPRSPA